jgi:hypothetical protein
VTCGISNMYQNFMDFTDDRCLAAFTHGQVQMMQTVRDVYYPGMAAEGGCAAYGDYFSAWFEELVWAHDAPSDTYVIYGEDIWPGRKDIVVYSADGKIILEDVWDDQLSYLLDLGNVASGVYFVRIADDDDAYVRKVIAY